MPEFYFGEDALEELATLNGRRAMIVTDRTLAALGYADIVQRYLTQAGIKSRLFTNVLPDPELTVVRAGAAEMAAFGPDWIVALGGGSVMDAAKAMWVLYERPSIAPEAISPLEALGLRAKARLICIPTTAGTGSEASYAMILTDVAAQRKLTLANRETTPDMALVDPLLTMEMPAQLTADTGLDVLTHAVEAYTCTWANDFTDGLCLQALKLVFAYLPRAVANGAADAEAREKMANAAAIAGMTLGNSTVALAHAMSHSAGAIFKQIPHGRLTAIFLPYTIQFIANSGRGRYHDLTHALHLAAADEAEAAQVLVKAIHELMQQVGQPVTLQDAGVRKEALQENLALVRENVEADANSLMSPRIPESEEIEKLLWCAFKGTAVDF